MDIKLGIDFSILILSIAFLLVAIGIRYIAMAVVIVREYMLDEKERMVTNPLP